jgi:hypothetical protein
MMIMGLPIPDGIDADTRLQITTQHGDVLALDLRSVAVWCRTGHDLLPFVYRDPYDPDLPDEPRPLRQAHLTVIGDRIVEGEPNIPLEVAAHVLFSDRLDGGLEPGMFTTLLLDAWKFADVDNTRRLAQAFPDYAAAIRLMQQPDGVDTLRKIARGEPTG